MSLTKEKIAANAERYFKAGNKFGYMTDDLIKFLGEDVVTAPASTMKDLHNAFEGGLLAHVLLVSEIAMKLNDILPAHAQVDKGSLIKVCMLHQIAKSNMYKPCTSEWHIKNQGKIYEFKDGTTSMKVGERSLYYAMTCGVVLTEEEAQAILNHDKDDTDKQAKWYSSRLADVLKQANMMAIMIEKSEASITPVA